MAAVHAKPLSRRQLRARLRWRKRSAVTLSALLLAGVAVFAVNTPGVPAALGVPARSPNAAVTRVDTQAASRSSQREQLLLESISVDSTGKWVMTNDRLDVNQLTRETPKPQVEDDAGNTLQATQETVDIVNDTQAPLNPVRPAVTGDAGNMYPWGQCTWWAYERRHQLGLPAGSQFGNAASWGMSAAALGYLVDHTPTVGAIIVFQPGQAGADPTYGHVAVVEHITETGGVVISESNAQGLGVISNRTLTDATQYTYIH